MSSRVSFLVLGICILCFGRSAAQGDCYKDSDCPTKGDSCIQNACGVNLGGTCYRDDDCAGLLHCQKEICSLQKCVSVDNCTTTYDETSPDFDVKCVLDTKGNGFCGYDYGTKCLSNGDCGGDSLCIGQVCAKAPLVPVLAPALAPILAPLVDTNAVPTTSSSPLTSLHGCTIAVTGIIFLLVL